METIQPLIKDLPKPESALRFFNEFSVRYPSAANKLLKDRSLLSDVLSVSAYSPLLATTILQHPDYVRWLGRERQQPSGRDKDVLLESLARFALTNTTLDPGVMLARFRRRELIRIFLKDIRNLATIAEITEEISNLADAVLEYAVQISKQELDNRYGMPLEIDEHGKATRAGFCVVALGKLGSKELNYSSDIDLMFIYSADGSTSGQGRKGQTSNKEYFVKLAEFVSRVVSDQSGEGGAYRVDHRLRPHGRVGSLAVSLREATAYYKDSAQLWEKQVLIRSRNSAGDPEVFQGFYSAVEPFVFSSTETVENALGNVLRSKQKIDLEKIRSNGFDVKLGVGGIREIEFIAQALQLAFGATDRWLRAPHTLISLSRLSDRRLISESEFTELFESYVFLRRIEHRLQMENGLQTHLVPDDPGPQEMIAARMGFPSAVEFIEELRRHTANVSRVFKRFFDHTAYVERESGEIHDSMPPPARTRTASESLDEESGSELAAEKADVVRLIRRYAPPLIESLAGHPALLESLPDCGSQFHPPDHHAELMSAAEEKSFPAMLSVLRQKWSKLRLRIVVADLCKNLDLQEAKRQQTVLAEASIRAAHRIAEIETGNHFASPDAVLPMAVLGLGKLGGGGMDYHSDLDLVLVHDDDFAVPVKGISRSEFYAKAVEVFVTVLSSMTRDGSLYRVDLRLRPDGKNGATSVGTGALLEYLKNRSAIWEWLAYAKARTVYSPGDFAKNLDEDVRAELSKRAAETGRSKLKLESWRIRQRLESERSAGRSGKIIDIKYGEGGLQDVYFAIRYLQLATGIMDRGSDSSTAVTLKRLLEGNAISFATYTRLDSGYRFLSLLDHNIRLAVGRSTIVPLANRDLLSVISERMGRSSAGAMLEELAEKRMAVREGFEEVLGADR